MLERADIVDLYNTILDDFITRPPPDPSGFSLRATSGTSGQPPVVVVSDFEKGFAPIHGWYWGDERVLVCYGPIDLRVNNVIAVTREPGADNRTLALDGADLRPDVQALLDDFAPQRIIGSVSFVLRAAEHMGVKTREDVRAVKCVGEYMTKIHAAAFKERFPNARLSTGYFTMEFGPISKETCGNLPANWYHPADDVTFEIHEPDTDGIGDILVTTRAHGKDIERYRIGDIGTLHDEPCACGEKTSIEVLGRKGLDYIKVAGALLVRDEFDRVAATFQGLVDDYRVEASVADHGGRLRARVRMQAVSRFGTPSEARRREIESEFAERVYVTARDTLADLVGRGAFEPLSIEWVDSFPKTNKVVKLRHV